jgi:hypothetical protein
MVCPPEVPRLLTLPEMSRSGIPERTLRYHVAIGALAARKIGKRWYVAGADAEQYFREMRIGNTDNLAIAALAHAS